MADELSARRAWYAEEVLAVAGVEDARLGAALAAVAREEFLPGPPWQLLAGRTLKRHYRQTEQAQDLYHDVLVALDAERAIHNGLPSMLATLIHALGVQRGERVVHVGCGTGYYTAVLAELAGAEGQVLAVEIDAGLAAQAQANLARYKQVRVVCGDGSRVDLGGVDAILVNAGVQRPALNWLESLRTGGRLLLPLGVGMDAQTLDTMAFRIERQAEGWRAEALAVLMLIQSGAERDAGAQRALYRAFADRTLLDVRWLRRDEHEPVDGCVVHASGYCLSRTNPSRLTGV